jgi:hypothetical protein
MKNLDTATALLIAVIPVLITAASQWALKLYELKIAKAAPNAAQETPKETQNKMTKRQKTDRLFVGAWAVTVLSAIANMVLFLYDPIKWPQVNAAIVSFQICVVFFACSTLPAFFVFRKTNDALHGSFVLHKSLAREIEDLRNKVNDLSKAKKKK